MSSTTPSNHKTNSHSSTITQVCYFCWMYGRMEERGKYNSKTIICCSASNVFLCAKPAFTKVGKICLKFYLCLFARLQILCVLCKREAKHQRVFAWPVVYVMYKSHTSEKSPSRRQWTLDVSRNVTHNQEFLKCSGIVSSDEQVCVIFCVALWAENGADITVRGCLTWALISSAQISQLPESRRRAS